jgi:hypothetical protein
VDALQLHNLEMLSLKFVMELIMIAMVQQTMELRVVVFQ